jgi:uncharacterized protein
MKIRTAAGFLDRLRGWWPRPPAEDADVLRFERCRCVHTLGMRQAIDVVFIDSKGQVLKLYSRLPPWRIVWHRMAREVWELRAGEAEQRGLLPGSSVSRQQSGASMIELLVALMFVIWPLISSLLEYSQLSVARFSLEHAVAEVARAAERTEENPAEGYLTRVLAHHVLPGGVARAVQADADFDTTALMAAAQARSLVPGVFQLRLQHLRSVGQSTALGAHEIELQASWCREMYFAPARQFIAAVAMRSARGIFDVQCLARGGFPLHAKTYAWRPVSRIQIVEP